MNNVRWAVLIAVLFGTLFVAAAAQAGDVKGKVSAEGLKSAEDIAVYIEASSGQEIRSSGPACNPWISAI